MKIIKMIILLSLWLSMPALALPNPAATNCIKKGYRYLLVRNVGICQFPDHSICEEWAYFRGQCRPGQIYPFGAKRRNH